MVFSVFGKTTADSAAPLQKFAPILSTVASSTVDGIVSVPVISPELLAVTPVSVALPDDKVYDHVNAPSSYV